MRKLASAAAVAATALAIAACGGGSGESAAGGGPPAGSATVSVRSVGDLGDALVTSDGMTLYSSDVEAKGGIVCTGGCTSFWKPLTPSAGKPSAQGDVGRLAVVKRPDGSRQVTSNGRPLYTFAEDGPGETKGDGFTDDFSGRHFVWHAMVAGGRPVSSSSGSSGGGGAYSGGGY